MEQTKKENSEMDSESDTFSSQNELTTHYKFIPKSAQGYGLILNITKIKNQQTRMGTEKDIQAIVGLFQSIGVEHYSVVENMKKSDIVKPNGIFDQFINQFDPKFYDFILIVILSIHGTQTSSFYSRDGKEVSILDEIILPKFSNSSKLVGVPKIFITQAFHSLSLLQNSEKPEESVELQKKYDEIDDVIIIYSTLPDLVSRRETSGSFYIQTLCKVFKDNFRGKDIIELLELVNTELKKTKLTVDVDEITVQLQQSGGYSQFNFKKFIFNYDFFPTSSSSNTRSEFPIMNGETLELDGSNIVE